MTHDEVIKHLNWMVDDLQLEYSDKEAIQYAIEFMKSREWQPIDTLNKKIRFDYVYETEKGNRYIVYGAYWHKKANRIQGTRLGQTPYNGCKILFWRPEDKPPTEDKQ